MRSGTGIYGEAFSDSVQKYLRRSGYSQQQLADVLGLHPKVLSRKLNGSGNAHLTRLEIQRIVSKLAEWHAITTQDEAIDLLSQAQMPSTIFSADEWQTPPLSTLETKRARPIASIDANLPTSSFQHNLPAQMTRLIGREWAVERICQLLGRDDIRIVTLTGSGGCGKTRLAQDVSGKLVSAFTHGVWFVALAGVSDPAQLTMSIIQTLQIKSTPDVPPLQSLIAYLKNRHLLLVLDNFEQVVEAATSLEELLAEAPSLKILVTSRTVLHLYGEHKFSVPPLDVPDLGVSLTTTQYLHYGAIQLFVERAQAALPNFALTDENASTIAHICARVDGLPLALELAAARIKMLPPTLLLEQLSQARLPMLTRRTRNTPARQQTLSNTIKWSYDLLSPIEQAWFSRLGVFTGGWSLEAAEALMQDIVTEQEDGADSALDMLEALLDNSLIIRLPDAEKRVRFTMLETLREYALAQLTARGEFERLHDWHACYYLRQAEAAELGVRGPQQLTWLAQLTTDRDNFRAALDWSLQRASAGATIHAFPQQVLTHRVAGSSILSSQGACGPALPAVELSLRLAAAFRPYWEWQGYLNEARNWVTAALALPFEQTTRETVRAARAKALSEASRLMCLHNDQERAAALAEESIALWQDLHDPNGLAGALLHRAWADYARGAYTIAKSTCLEALECLAPTDDLWLRGQVLVYLGAAAGFTGDFEQMRYFYTQSRELFEQVGDTSAVADVLKDHGAMMILESKYAESIDSLLKSIQICYKLDHKQYLTTGLCWLSIAFGMRGEPDAVMASIQSAQLDGAADGLMEAIGLTPWANSNTFVQVIRQQIRSQVDEQSWQAAWTAGRALKLEQAIDLAHRLAEGLPS